MRLRQREINNGVMLDNNFACIIYYVIDKMMDDKWGNKLFEALFLLSS